MSTFSLSHFFKYSFTLSISIFKLIITGTVLLIKKNILFNYLIKLVYNVAYLINKKRCGIRFLNEYINDKKFIEILK